MALQAGTHQLGPDNAALQVKTYREGAAAKVGHDLVFDVARWEATLVVTEGDALSTLELSADPESLEIREGVGGIKPLSDKDRADIGKNIDEKVLAKQPISFRSDSLELSGDGGGLSVRGELTIAGDTKPVSAELSVDSEGHVTGTIPLTQSEWGIKPYKAMMGALKVRDSVDVVLDAHVPVA